MNTKIQSKETLPEHTRALSLIKRAVHRLNLDLSGYTILTEVGSGSYLYTPVIAAIAGAERVFAWTKDSRYGKSEDIVKQCESVLENLMLSSSVQFSCNNKPAEHVKQADIITNSGFVRPLNGDLLQNAKPGVVIPLMFEAWELRESDIDIQYCISKGIRVAGTDEKHPTIRVFDYVGPLALKLALNARMEILNNSILIWSDDEFGKVAAEAFEKAGAKRVIQTTDVELLYANAEDLDFVFICDYHQLHPIIGNTGIFNLNKLHKTNPSLTFVHLYGDIDNRYAKELGFCVYPDKKGNPQVMTETLAYSGLTPIVNLQVAGFKVGQEMLENKISELTQPLTFTP